jgi:hypothetical protein
MLCLLPLRQYRDGSQISAFFPPSVDNGCTVRARVDCTICGAKLLGGKYHGPPREIVVDS